MCRYATLDDSQGRSQRNKWRFVSAKSVKNICVWNVCSNYNLYERVFVDIVVCVCVSDFSDFRPT